MLDHGIPCYDTARPSLEQPPPSKRLPVFPGAGPGQLGGAALGFGDVLRGQLLAGLLHAFAGAVFLQRLGAEKPRERQHGL